MRTRANQSMKLWTIAVFGVGLWIASRSSSAACLEKHRLSNGGLTIDTFMIAPESEVAEYASLGFHRVACPADLSVVRRYVERICSGTPLGKMPALNTEAAIGRSREYACASARAGLVEAGG